MIFREVEDRDLIAKARRGDVEAYNLLVSRWEKRVFNYLLRLVSNREDALDLSQDVFLKAYQNLPKLDDVERFPAWLFRIGHNEAFSPLRRLRATWRRSLGLPSPARACCPSSCRWLSRARFAALARTSAKRSCSRCIKDSSSTKWPKSWAARFRPSSRACTRRSIF